MSNTTIAGGTYFAVGRSRSAADVYRASELIRDADTQLYRAKRLGRNRVESAAQASGMVEESIAAE